jgi:hypothetical protein
VSVRPKGRRRWAVVGTADQCEGWAGRASGRHFRLRQLGGDAQTLLFVPRTPRRTGREDFQYRVTRATVSESGRVSTGRTFRRGAFREGKTVWMHNGNPYCIDPALTDRTVKLLR